MESESQGKFSIGGGLNREQLKKIEDLKKGLQQQGWVGGISAAQAIPIKEGAGVGVTVQTKTGEESWFRAGAKNAPKDLKKYDRPGKKNETEDELVARLLKERAEKKEEEGNVANEITRGLEKNSGFAEQLGKKIAEDQSKIIKKQLSVAEELEGSFSSNNKKETLDTSAGEDEDETKEEKIKEEKNEIARDLAAALEENARIERLKTEEGWLEEAAAQEAKPIEETFALEKKLEEDIKSVEEAVSASKKEGGAGSVKLQELESKRFGLMDELRKLRLEKKLRKEAKSAYEVAEVKVSENLEKNPISPKISEEKILTIEEEKYKKNMVGETPPEIGAFVQEKINKFNKSLDVQANKIEKEAVDKGCLGVIRAVGRNWKEAKLTYKGILALTVIAGISSGGVAALLGVSVGFAARFGGSAAAFVGIEAVLEKKRREKEHWWNKYPKTMAAIPAIIMSGGIGKAATGITEASEWLSHTWDNVFGGVEAPVSAVVEKANIEALSKDAIKPFAMEGFEEQSVPPASEKLVTTSVKEIPVTPPITSEVQTALEQAHETILSPEAPLGAEEVVKAASVVAAEGVHAVISGENLHNIIGGMKELNELDGGRKENAIANIIEQINKNPAEYGIASGDIDRLAVGDRIDMEKIHQAFEQTKIDGESVIEHAKHLTEKDVFDIDVQRMALSDWREAHPNEPFTTETTSEILQKTNAIDLSDGEDIGKTPAESAADSSPPAQKELTEQLQSVANIGTMAELPDVAKKYIENTIGLNNIEWASLRGKTASSFLDNFYFDSDSHEAKLNEYINTIVDDTKAKPNFGETILEFIKRTADYKK